MDFVGLFIKTINLQDGQLINEYININKLSFNIIKNNNIISIDLKNNTNFIDLNKILNNYKELLIIIRKEEYKEMIKLIYNDQQKLVNYNNKYYIIEIRPYLDFKTNYNNINNISEKFSNLE
tara:strand:+ start:192 stop:557 length:366 start_codon:yes stop_codon:yes gene_type:complete